MPSPTALPQITVAYFFKRQIYLFSFIPNIWWHIARSRLRGSLAAVLRLEATQGRPSDSRSSFCLKHSFSLKTHHWDITV